MSFSVLQIQYQSAGVVPPPYAHFYELTAKPAPDCGLAVDFAITYVDRETLDEEDITGEGFTMTDDFSWSGTLGAAWLPVIDTLAGNTPLDSFAEDLLGDADDFLAVIIERNGAKSSGTPAQPETFLYTVQELIQATYEAGGKENPFDLTYLNRQQSADLDIRLRASFAERRFTIEVVENSRHTPRELPWSALQPFMGQLFKHDFDPALGMAKVPRRDGHFLALGEGAWHDIGNLRAVQQALLSLATPLS